MYPPVLFPRRCYLFNFPCIDLTSANAPSIQVENRPWNSSFPLVQTSSPRCANKESSGSPTDPLQRSAKRDNLNSAWTNPLQNTAGINASLQGKKECTLVTICPDMFWNVGHLPLKQWSSSTVRTWCRSATCMGSVWIWRLHVVDFMCYVFLWGSVFLHGYSLGLDCVHSEQG